MITPFSPLTFEPGRPRGLLRAATWEQGNHSGTRRMKLESAVEVLRVIVNFLCVDDIQFPLVTSLNANCIVSLCTWNTSKSPPKPLKGREEWEIRGAAGHLRALPFSALISSVGLNPSGNPTKRKKVMDRQLSQKCFFLPGDGDGGDDKRESNTRDREKAHNVRPHAHICSHSPAAPQSTRSKRDL